MPKAQRDHYLPAAYLGRFSSKVSGRSRNRPLYVSDRRARSPFVESAENIGCRRGLYDLPEVSEGWLGNHIDLWGYEAGLPAALDHLSDRHSELDAGVWLRHLVPFVAGLFSRGPDHNGGRNSEARIMALQEMLAPVMAAQWTVLHYPRESVVTSDRAIAAIDSPVGSGIAVPLDRSSVLLISGCARRDVATYQAGRWSARVGHCDMTDGDDARLRQALAQFAMHSIFGPTAASVANSGSIGVNNAEWPGLMLNPSNCDLACHLYDYFRVASAIAVEPDEAQAAADRIDLDAVLPDWRSPIAMQLTFVERTCGGVTVEGGSVNLSLELGLELCARRRTVGDFRLGGFAIVPFEHLRNLPVPLGHMCRGGADGRAPRTPLSSPETGAVTTIDLPSGTTAMPSRRRH